MHIQCSRKCLRLLAPSLSVLTYERQSSAPFFMSQMLTIPKEGMPCAELAVDGMGIESKATLGAPMAQHQEQGRVHVSQLSSAEDSLAIADVHE